MARTLTKRDQPKGPGLRSSMSLSAVTAGFVAVAVSYAGPMLVVCRRLTVPG